MPHFRKKPIVVEAIRFDGTVEGVKAVDEFVGEKVTASTFGRPWKWYCYFETLEGTMCAGPGDWIIKGVQGEFYPCKPDIFEATYEKVVE